MRRLTVNVSGDPEEDRMLALPFDVYGPDGEPLEHGIAWPGHAKTVDLPEIADDMSRVHVVAVRPSGERLQTSTALVDGPNEVTLQVGWTSPREWLRWVTPFRSVSHLPGYDNVEPLPGDPRRIGAVWMTLWALQDGSWKAMDLKPQDQERGKGARQITLKLPEAPHMIQVGGEEVSWRLVSLPPASEVRIALTRRAGDDGDSVDVTVGRVKPLNELLMSYLSSGDMMEAERLADAWEAADLALYKKMEDPVSAAAGAYALLKLKRLDGRRAWIDNLVAWFPYIADGPIVAAALALQRADANQKVVRDYISLAMERGLPIFAIGMSTLVQTMAAVHRGKKESKKFQMWYQAARAYLQARVGRGAYFSFYGRSPAEPSWEPIRGEAIAPIAATSEPDILGSGPRYSSPRRRTVAPAIERGLEQSTSSNASDDLLRLGLARQYNLPAIEGLRALERWNAGPAASGGRAMDASSDLNVQRVHNAFTVFGGDE